FTTLRVNSPSFSGRIVPLFDSMLVPQGKGSGTPTESHHTPSPEVQQTSPTTHSSSSLPPITTATIPPVISAESLPTVIPSDNPPLMQYTKRTRIDQSSVLPPVVDEPASPLGDDSQASILTSEGVQVVPTALEVATTTIARDAKIAIIHVEKELQMLIDGLDRNNETVAKYLQEYDQFAADLPFEKRIELISNLVKYQDHYAKTLKYQTQQRKLLG
nr:hypothetical protein [Tanacetum cinerariifolium]